MKPFLKLVSLLSSLRSLWVLLTLVLFLAPLSIAWLDLPNLWLFRVGVQLSPKPEPSNNLVKIGVNSLEMERFIKDVPSASGMGELLQGLRSVYTKSVVILLDQIPQDENYALELLSQNNLEPSESVELKELLVRQKAFKSGVSDGAILLALSQTEAPVTRVNYLRESQRVLERKDVADTSPVAKILAYDQGAFHSHALALASFRYESDVQGLAFFNGTNPAYPLLWRVKDALFPDAALEILKKSYGAKQISYQQPTLFLDDHQIPISAGAVIYPFYSLASGKNPPVESLTLEDIRSTKSFESFHNKVVLIGVKGSAQLDNLAAVYYSLEKKAYYTTPAWYLWAEKGGLLILFLYIMFLLPRLQIKLALTVSFFLSLLLFISSLGLQISNKLWVPIALLVIYLLLGHLCVLLSQLMVRLFGEWELIVVEKGKSPVRHNHMHPVRQEPRVVSAKKAATGTSKLSQILDKTMAITRPSKKLKFGRYEIDRELGRGAMGVVYLGHDPLIDRLVAIKTLNYAQFSPSELIDVKNRFFREAKAVGKFAHDNIVTIYDTGEDEQRAFIAMEYVEGKPLSLYTKKNTLIKNPDEVYWLMESVSDALHYAHEKGVVHRDIKPANILYDLAHNKVKVSDFGIARIVDSSATRTGEIMGSPLYMSPEQIKGETVTGKTDIYSLGVTFYQLLTGELPFTGDTIPAITHQIIQGKYIPVTDINPRLPQSAQKIIAKAMHKDPQRRYADAAAMMEDIAKWREKDF